MVVAVAVVIGHLQEDPLEMEGGRGMCIARRMKRERVHRSLFLKRNRVHFYRGELLLARL
jgi:hypothetical protein